MRYSKISTAIAIVGGLALLGGSAAIAGDPNTTQPAASQIKNDTGKRICKVVTPTGSRFSERVCRTALDWQRDADAAQRHIQEADQTIRENGCGFQCGQ
jgi:hypothetical protein